MLNLPTIEELRERYTYDPETGILRFRKRLNGFVKVGQQCGYVNPQGYRMVSVNNRNMAAHRVIWAIYHGEWPPSDMQIDHANGDRDDNRICNLRLATPSQNAGNSRRASDNATGYKGVSYIERLNKWRATIRMDGKNHHLGCFLTPEDAHAAYVKAANDRWGEFANSG